MVENVKRDFINDSIAWLWPMIGTDVYVLGVTIIKDSFHHGISESFYYYFVSAGDVPTLQAEAKVCLL